MSGTSQNRRIQETQSLVKDSTSIHGGPHEDCDECADIQPQKLDELRSTNTEWKKFFERWQLHLHHDQPPAPPRRLSTPEPPAPP